MQATEVQVLSNNYSFKLTLYLKCIVDAGLDFSWTYRTVHHSTYGRMWSWLWVCHLLQAALKSPLLLTVCSRCFHLKTVALELSMLL
jgi:hypothetical protein